MLRLRSNDQLVNFFRAGDDDAFRVIHDRYRGQLLTYVRHVMGSTHADAEDVLQDVFVRAYRGLRAHDRKLNLSPWLYRVARNACVDELRRRLPVPYDELPNNDRALDPDPVLAESLTRDRIRQLMSDLQQLPEQQRSALILCEVSGMSYAEVADTLGTSVSAVKSLLVRARLGLAQSLEARETACSEIRDELACAHAKGERPNALVRRHMHDCRGCRGYGVAMRDRKRELAALSPTLGPIAILGKVFGFGGAGGSAGASAAAAGGTGAASGGGLAVSAGLIGAGATHVLTVVAATGIVAAGAIGIKEATTTHTPQAPATPAAPSYVPPESQAATASPIQSARAIIMTGYAASQRVAAPATGSTVSRGASSSSGASASRGSTTGYTPPSSPPNSGSTGTSCPIGQQCSSAGQGASTGYTGPSATNAGNTSSKLPLGNGATSTGTSKSHMTTPPIGGGAGTATASGPAPQTTSSSSSGSLSSQPLGSSGSPALGSTGSPALGS